MDIIIKCPLKLASRKWLFKCKKAKPRERNKSKEKWYAGKNNNMPYYYVIFSE